MKRQIDGWTKRIWTILNGQRWTNTKIETHKDTQTERPKGVGVGHHNLWYIVLDDLWSKKICRLKMIVWSLVLQTFILDDFVWYASQSQEISGWKVWCFKQTIMITLHSKMDIGKYWDTFTLWIQGLYEIQTKLPFIKTDGLAGHIIQAGICLELALRCCS